jgi:hypothetical protein
VRFVSEGVRIEMDKKFCTALQKTKKGNVTKVGDGKEKKIILL